MDNETFFVLRAVKTGRLEALEAYPDVVAQALASGLLIRAGRRLRVPGLVGVDLFDEECRRQEDGRDIDRDPRAASAAHRAANNSIRK